MRILAFLTDPEPTGAIRSRASRPGAWVRSIRTTTSGPCRTTGARELLEDPTALGEWLEKAIDVARRKRAKTK
jgi:hypothetical protein